MTYDIEETNGLFSVVDEATRQVLAKFSSYVLACFYIRELKTVAVCYAQLRRTEDAKIARLGA